MTEIGQYRIVRLLGKGGMSEVYEVENNRLGSRHALKLFTYEKNDPEVRERFLVEGKLLARLNHPRIVKVTDFGTDEVSGKPYFVMDLVLNERGEMQLLSDVEPGTVDEEMVGKWYDDLREGLSYIHANGVVHRDLKLQNVLIGPDGHSVLMDFGISKILDAKDGGTPIVDTLKTLVKVRDGRSLVMGSIGYMAPELEMGVEASPKSDYYALGVIIYRLLTGTWCDARTDVVGTLETYDPVWKRILPKLLHSNPQGRECLSYADEKLKDWEKSEFEWEERWLKEKCRSHLARHVARYAGLVTVALVATIWWMFGHYTRKIAEKSAQVDALEARLAIPSFSDVFHPLEGVDQSPDGKINDFQAQATLVDAWVLTHVLFDDLRAQRITTGKAIESLETMAARAETDFMGLFGIGNPPHGDVKMLQKVLRNAAEELKNKTAVGKREKN